MHALSPCEDLVESLQVYFKSTWHNVNCYLKTKLSAMVLFFLSTQDVIFLFLIQIQSNPWIVEPFSNLLPGCLTWLVQVLLQAQGSQGFFCFAMAFFLECSLYIGRKLFAFRCKVLNTLRTSPGTSLY